MSVPRVTALLPVRSYHRIYLERSVGSVLEQTSSSWRLIVIDDGAGPELRDVLGPALGDTRVRLVTSEGQRLAAALNTGMRHATTEFTAILLGDDMWAPEAVEVLTSYIERFRDVDFFYSSRAFVDERDSWISSVYRARESFTLADFVRGSPVKHLLCWRRGKGLEIGGIDETLDPVGLDDYDFPWSMAEAGARFMAVPECLYLFRDHRDCFRLTTHLPRSTHVRTLRRILRKHRVGRLRAEYAIARAKRSYLRQCLYRSRFDRRLKDLRRFDPQEGWRYPYR